jgi:IS6 family transposase
VHERVLTRVSIFRWVQRFTPLLAHAAHPCRHRVGDRWWMDETYVKVSGRWRYVYRAIDQFGQVIDVYVSPRRDGGAARCWHCCVSSRDISGCLTFVMLAAWYAAC